MEVRFDYSPLGRKIEEQAKTQGLTLGDQASVIQSLIDAKNVLYCNAAMSDQERDRISFRINEMVKRNLAVVEP